MSKHGPRHAAQTDKAMRYARFSDAGAKHHDKRPESPAVARLREKLSKVRA